MERSKVIPMFTLEEFLTSCGRTTDLLESLTGDAMVPSIREQVVDGSSIRRVSVLYRKLGGQPVSYNVGTIAVKYTPVAVLTAIQQQKQGIGETLRQESVASRRHILRYGFLASGPDWSKIAGELQVIDNRPIPFKEYLIHFMDDDHPGIHLVEYFHPDLYQDRNKG